MAIFKAYDIRGVYPDELNEDMARKVGNAFAQHLDTKAIVVGRDMRISGPSLFNALSEGIRDFGTDVVDIGLSTTPMSYFADGFLGTGGDRDIPVPSPPLWLWLWRRKTKKQLLFFLLFLSRLKAEQKNMFKKSPSG